MCNQCNENRVGVLRRHLLTNGYRSSSGDYYVPEWTYDGSNVTTANAKLMLDTGVFIVSCVTDKCITYTKKENNCE